MLNTPLLWKIAAMLLNKLWTFKHFSWVTAEFLKNKPQEESSSVKKLSEGFTKKSEPTPRITWTKCISIVQMNVLRMCLWEILGIAAKSFNGKALPISELSLFEAFLLLSGESIALREKRLWKKRLEITSSSVCVFFGIFEWCALNQKAFSRTFTYLFLHDYVILIFSKDVTIDFLKYL